MSFYNKHGASCCLKETNTDKSFTHTSFRPLLYTEECVVSHYHLFKGCRFLNVRIFSACVTEVNLMGWFGLNKDFEGITAGSGTLTRGVWAPSQVIQSGILKIWPHVRLFLHPWRVVCLFRATVHANLSCKKLLWSFVSCFLHTCGSRSTPGIFGIILYKFEGHNTFEDDPRNHNELKHKRRRRWSVQQ